MHHRPAALLLLAALAGPAPALAQPAPRPPVPKPATPDPAFEAARSAFEARPEDERRRVQDALVWAGDYNSVTTGAFGRRTFEALQAWQARAGAQGTGILDDRDRAALLAAGEAARKAAGFVVREDPATGLVLGVPERLLPKRSRQPDGARWQSTDGRVTLDSKAFAPGAADLDGLFERATLATPDRKVTYKLRRPDFLVVTGETATGKFYIRYAAGAAGVRGFTLAYDKALARDLDRLMIAVANSFVPFPAEAPTVAAAAASPPPARPAAPQPAAAEPAGAVTTGLVVAPGRVVTVGACPAPQVAGAPARLVRQDPAGGLALIEAGVTASGSLVAAPGLPDPDAALVVVAAGREGGPAVAPGVAGPGGTVAAPLQPGAAGAPVLDRSGRLLGLVARLPARPRLIAGVMPPTSHPVVGLDALRMFLGRDATLPPATGEAAPRSAGAIAASVAGRVVAVRCGS